MLDGHNTAPSLKLITFDIASNGFRVYVYLVSSLQSISCSNQWMRRKRGGVSVNPEGFSGSH